MIKPIRAAFGFECALTTLGGLQALFAPASSATQFVPVAPSAPAIDLVRWLGTAWLVIATLQLGLLRSGTREAWRIAIPPLLLGDALHVAVQGVMIADGGVVGGAYGGVVVTLVFATCRVLAYARPERVHRD